MVDGMTKSITPQIGVAVRDHGLAERLARELRSRVSGADLSVLAGARFLKDAVFPARGAPIDIIVADPAMARLVAEMACDGHDPLVAVVVGPEPDEGLNELAAKHGYVLFQLGSEPRPFINVAIWLSGCIACTCRGVGVSRVVADLGRRYEELVQALPDIVYELNPEGVITFINESVSMLGYAPADLIGKHYSVLLNDDDAAAVDRDKVLPEYIGYKTGLLLSPKLFNERRGFSRRTSDLEVRLRRKPGMAGTTFDIIGSVIAYGEISSAGAYSGDDRKDFKGTVGIIRDITLRRKSEEMLRKLYQAIDQLSACVFVLNHGFEIEYVNPVFFMLTGFGPPEVIGASIFKFIAMQEDKAERVARRVHDGFDAKDEVLVPRSAGGQFWATLALAPVRSPAGAITHAIAILEDISARKTMEDLLRNAKIAAETANQAKSRFLSSMTHELKNPINSIMTAAHLLEFQPTDAPARLSSILSSSQTLLEMLNGILDYVRSENSTIKIQRLAFPLAAFMERTCKPFRAAATAKGLEFHLFIEADQVLESDPDRLDRVITVLLDNAVKYTDKGSVSVSAAIEHPEGNIPHLKIRVTDTGMGIRAINRERIFRPFSRAELPGGSTSRGAGIGLALARNVVRVLGGEIRLGSEPGVGSEFTIIVPVGAPTKAFRGSAARYTVLVVDDNEVNLEYMRTLIENSGYLVHCASSAAEAFRVLETKYVDAGLLDIQMPGYSGAELAKAIRAYAGPRYSSSMPLFAMTAQDQSAMGQLEDLFAIVFPKPTDIGKFSAALNDAMAERETVTIPVPPSGERLDGGALVMEKMRTGVESAIAALSLALAGTSDATVDIKAQASVLSAAFMRIASASGQELVRLFLEHYADEDRIVLVGLLDRIARMLESGFASHLVREP